jgi:hypothetical protein
MALDVESVVDGSVDRQEGELAQRDVRHLSDQCQDLPGMGFDPLRAIISALRPRPEITSAATDPPI